MPISRENLFKIRPTGLVSKNRTGALNTAVSMEWWRFFEDKTKEFIAKAALKNDKKKAAAPKPPKIYKFLVWNWGSCDGDVTLRSHQSGSVRNPMRKQI